MKVQRGIAQLVAHLLWEQGVASSSPATPTIYVSIAQLDRATAFYAVGRGFKSLLGHQTCSDGRAQDTGACLEKKDPFRVLFSCLFFSVRFSVFLRVGKEYPQKENICENIQKKYQIFLTFSVKGLNFLFFSDNIKIHFRELFGKVQRMKIFSHRCAFFCTETRFHLYFCLTSRQRSILWRQKRHSWQNG